MFFIYFDFFIEKIRKFRLSEKKKGAAKRCAETNFYFIMRGQA